MGDAGAFIAVSGLAAALQAREAHVTRKETRGAAKKREALERSRMEKEERERLQTAMAIRKRRGATGPEGRRDVLSVAGEGADTGRKTLLGE